MVSLRKNFIFRDVSAINFINLADKEKEITRILRNDKRINNWLFDEHYVSRQEHMDFIEKLKVNNKDFYWLLKRNNADYYLGVISLSRVYFKNKNAYLGVYANPSFPGAGHMLMNCLKNLAFKVGRLHTLKLETLADNKRAIRFFLKEGFRKEGKLKDFVLKKRTWNDVIVMGFNPNERKSGTYRK